MNFLVAFLIGSGFSSAEPDTVAAAKHMERFEALQYANVDSAIIYVDLAIAAVEGSDQRHAKLLLEKGKFLKNVGRYKDAETSLLASAARYAEMYDSTGLADAYNNLGIVYGRWLNNEKVIQYYSKSLQINKAIRNLPGQVRNYISIGNYYAQEVPRTTKPEEKERLFREAIAHYDNALILLESKPRGRNRALALQGKGNIYAHPAFSSRDSATSLSNFRQSLAEYQALGDSSGIAGLEISIGYLYESYNDLPSAEKHYVTAAALSRQLNQRTIVEVLLNLGNVYMAEKKFAKARSAYEEGLRYARSYDDIYKKSGYYQRLSEAHAALKEYDYAYAYLDSAIPVLNRINEESMTKSKVDSEVLYQTNQKEAEIKIRTIQRDSVFVVLIVALVLLIVIVLLSQQRQKAIAQLREKERALHLQKVDDLLKKQEITSLVSYLSGQDEERQRIAQDLHDRLGSILTATKLYFNSDDNGNGAVRDKANALLDSAVTEVREISHNMMSGTLSKFGLIQALEELAETVSKSGHTKMQFIAHKVGRYPGKVEITIYRVIQELVSNTLKHAGASEITAQVSQLGNELTVIMEDNGRGFDRQTALKNGIGLMNVESRVASLNGTVHIDSGKGSGTTITINIPVEASEAVGEVV